jgi:O-acetyl-ADP-ribose deacetylase
VVLVAEHENLVCFHFRLYSFAKAIVRMSFFFFLISPLIRVVGGMSSDNEDRVDEESKMARSKTTVADAPQDESSDDIMGRRAHTEPPPGEVILPVRNEINCDLHLDTSPPYRPPSPLDRYRERSLKAPFRRSEDEAMFRMSFAKWKEVYRESIPGWRCSVASPTNLSDLVPYAKDDLHILDKISIVHCGVTELALDAVVNAANEGCLGGGGVDGAIHSAAGPQLFRECCTFNGCPTGHTRMTKGYFLPAKFVLHTVGPIGERPKELQSCYRSCLQLAKFHGLRTVGFCCISTGIFGYPLAAATKVALHETFSFLKEHHENFDMLCFACFTKNELDVYNRMVDDVYRAVMTTKE